jgi:hypothetical protein
MGHRTRQPGAGGCGDCSATADCPSGEGAGGADELYRKADQAAERRTKKWETLKACQSYDSDPVLDQATGRIRIASEKGKNDRNPDVDQRDATCVLNYLDGLATGIAQNLYIEAVMRDHLGVILNHAVVNFVDSGLVDRDGLKSVLALHAKWFRPVAPTAYQSLTISN